MELDRQIATFLDYCLDNYKALSTVDMYRQLLGVFSQWLGANYPEIPGVESIELAHLQQFRRHLRLDSAARGKEIAASTQAKYISALRAFLRYARQELRLTVVNPEELGLPSKRMSREQKEVEGISLPRPEIARLLSQPDASKIWGARDRAIIALLSTTGLKVSQIIALDRRDVREELLGEVDILHMRVRSVRGLVSIDRHVQQLLRSYLSMRDDRYPPLFIRHKPGKQCQLDDPHHRLTRQMVHKMIEKHSLSAGIALPVSTKVLSSARISFSPDPSDS